MKKRNKRKVSHGHGIQPPRTDMGGAFRILLFSAFAVFAFASCGSDRTKPTEQTKLIYFGFQDHSEKPPDVSRLIRDWITAESCKNWRATVDVREADYQVLFGNVEDVQIVGRRGEVLFNGGVGVLYLPYGNPDRTGTNICKLTGEETEKTKDNRLTPTTAIIDSVETPRLSFYRVRFHTSNREFEATCSDNADRSCSVVAVGSQHGFYRSDNLMRFLDAKNDTLDWTIVKETVR
jgi:hypothetical protein